MTIAFRADARRYFIDTEFIEDGRTVDLVSLALVPEDPALPEFYACSAEADLARASEWVQKNVLPRLPPTTDARWMTRAAMRDALTTYLRVGPHRRGDEGKPELWGYYAAYDHVALCQLFGRMIDLPDGLPMYTMDLKQLSVLLGSPPHPPQDPAGAHDALCDARWHRELFRALRAAAETRA